MRVIRYFVLVVSVIGVIVGYYKTAMALNASQDATGSMHFTHDARLWATVLVISILTPVAAVALYIAWPHVKTAPSSEQAPVS